MLQRGRHLSNLGKGYSLKCGLTPKGGDTRGPHVQAYGLKGTQQDSLNEQRIGRSSIFLREDHPLFPPAPLTHPRSIWLRNTFSKWGESPPWSPGAGGSGLDKGVVELSPKPGHLMLCVARHQMINPSWQQPCGAHCYHSLKKQLPTDPWSQEDSCWVMISFTLFPFKPSELPHPAFTQLLLLLNGTSPGGRGTCWTGDRGQTLVGGKVPRKPTCRNVASHMSPLWERGCRASWQGASPSLCIATLHWAPTGCVQTCLQAWKVRQVGLTAEGTWCTAWEPCSNKAEISEFQPLFKN